MNNHYLTTALHTALHSALRCFAAAVAAFVFLPQLASAQPVPVVLPVNDISVDQLVASLSGGSLTRSFRRTSLPEAGSNLCAVAAAANSAGNAKSTPQSSGQSNTRNLEVVPYAGDTTPGVNLNVSFATASDQLTTGDRALLNKLAQALQTPSLAQERFAIAGHTDSTGDARVNLELSCARALAVQRHLTGQGVASARLSAYGFGATRLLVPDTPTGGANRRVEVRKAPE
jgi:outer membrane protein OmpA-like peptidoglycan-associated protein